MLSPRCSLRDALSAILSPRYSLRDTLSAILSPRYYLRHPSIRASGAQLREPLLPTIQLSIHPGARQKLDSDAQALLAYVAERKVTPAPPSPFPDEIHKLAIPDADVEGFRGETRDADGRVVERRFIASGLPYVLNREGCARLTATSERLSASRDLCTYVNRSFIDDLLFSWVIQNAQASPCPEKFSDYFIRHAQEAIKPMTIWTPVANLVVQSSFRFGGSEIRPLTAATVNTWEARALAKSPIHRDHLVEFFDRVRKYFQGYAAVVSTITAEEHRGEEHAYELADRVLAVLGLYSGAVLHSEVKCPFSTRGTFTVPGATFLIEHDGEIQSMKSGVRSHPTGMLVVRWSDGDLARLQSYGFGSASALLSLPAPNDFQTAMLNALFLYARAAYSDEPIDKVVHVLSSLESMMLKDENEPIQQNLGERLAVFTQTDLARRKAIIRATRDAYRLRSRYLHHGESSSDRTIIENLLKIAWDFYVKLLGVVDQHQTRLAFVQWVDDAKLG